jgi:hypothetical protein
VKKWLFVILVVVVLVCLVLWLGNRDYAANPGKFIAP